MFEPVVSREDLQKPTYLITQVAKPPELRIVKVSGPTMGNPVEDDAPPFPLRTILRSVSEKPVWLSLLAQ